MKALALLLALPILPLPLLTAPADAQSRRDQDAAYQLRETGKILPVRAIEARVVPMMDGMTYMGFEFYPATATYRLKFMDGRRMVWVDVDGRTGRILGRS